MVSPDITRNELAAMIDHAILRPDTSRADLDSGCRMAATYEVACACVRPCDVSEARILLEGSGVGVGTVIGFPHGSLVGEVKVLEAAQAVEDGAEELDMVLNIGWLRGGELTAVKHEIADVVAVAEGRIVKVILECCYLNRDEMATGCKIAEEGGAHFVKTSTGFGPAGATLDDVRFLRSQVGKRLGVKAAGGIRTLNDTLEMVRAGASRIGTSSTEAILTALLE
jgi:deoxyribose-phosphate aldolase